MILRITLVWIIGALIIIPYSVYNLIYHAQPEQYVFLIIMPLFWLFGFWGVVGPLIIAYRIRKLMNALESAEDAPSLRDAFARNEGKDVMLELIAKENRIPRLMAGWIYERVVEKLASKNAGAPQNKE